MQPSGLTPYLIRQEGDCRIFLPSSALVGIMVAAWSCGGALLCALAFILVRRAEPDAAIIWVASVPLLAAFYSVSLAVRAWRGRRRGLIVCPSGRIQYGGDELCAAGALRAVLIRPAAGGEAGDLEVMLVLDAGGLVPLPRLFFSAFKSSLHARPFATALAEAARVEVRETR